MLFVLSNDDNVVYLGLPKSGSVRFSGDFAEPSTEPLVQVWGGPVQVWEGLNLKPDRLTLNFPFNMCGKLNFALRVQWRRC